MKDSLTVHVHDQSIMNLAPSQELNLAQLLFLNGAFKGVPLCSGMGRCALCKVRFESNAPAPRKEELKKFNADEIKSGWRLSCLHRADAAAVFLPEPERVVPKVSGKFSEKLPGDLSLAVDLGTTGMHWAFIIGDEIVKSGQELNPQIGLGSEVMSRLAFAAKPEQCKILSDLVSGRIKEIIAETGPVKTLVVTGNPSMTSILAQDNVEGLSHAPYSLPSKGGSLISIDEKLPDAYIPAHLAPFVGADITAGIVALNFSGKKPEPPYLFADLGTNGEFVLCLSEDKYIVSSVPMGPALEGVGLSNGRTAGPGAISSFTLTPKGLAPFFISQPDENSRPGITGTGYLSLCSLLLKSGILTRGGQFASGNTPLAAKLARNLTEVKNTPALDLGLNNDLNLPATDVEEILKVKAAFNLAMSALLDQAELAPSDLNSLVLGGAMGQHVNINDLVSTGFIPAEIAGVTRAAGNTSLTGAIILTNNKNARDFASALPSRSSVLELAGSQDFGQKYLERMIFQYVY
ncbi:ASKHA domain-containing protein [Maridesulfovibrio hydrothermalis]|uniref:Putative Iron-sulfur cluster-binding protein n=1 Tax=Maridesulfovibrio hydrothermalis AM13 = DSM 14728 TaxID=1121451 RepID=L0REF8_9BACT|nr:ASKHA domain-containing protein [Maridesulfovibrio hydrothermalis]CCO23916.1 putative Iron-sulfur cluster-binding protein [Maridesulfovibrio hydrothermalis AM13 = DSM 14728]